MVFLSPGKNILNALDSSLYPTNMSLFLIRRYIRICWWTKHSKMINKIFYHRASLVRCDIP
jgi:hypothetical protein